MVQSDPRLSDENVASAFDALDDVLTAIAEKGANQHFHDALGRFRAAWPKRPTEPAPSNGATPET